MCYNVFEMFKTSNVLEVSTAFSDVLAEIHAIILRAVCPFPIISLVLG